MCPGRGGIGGHIGKNPSLSLCFPICKTEDTNRCYHHKIIVKIQRDNACKMYTNRDSNHYYYYCYFIPIRVEVVQAHSEIHFSFFNKINTILIITTKRTETNIKTSILPGTSQTSLGIFRVFQSPCLLPTSLLWCGSWSERSSTFWGPTFKMQQLLPFIFMKSAFCFLEDLNAFLSLNSEISLCTFMKEK